ncbi:tripartite tricarboxylate transporter TctB family protein [Marihabitans asiaticum]|uniref:tripartite tricarboxylate transporter TctB family protein n=1 Tax=Marihabitans asiaticum TaxID=415218 RepID=UPI0014796136|nr:tripartite tricarboxylate transporter TctB family protein [Marihabitans asiaticum]
MLGIAVILSTAGLSGQGPSDPGADGYPRIIAVGLITLGVMLLLQRGEQKEVRLARPEILRVACAFALLVGYYFMLKSLGYILPTTVLIAGGLLIMGVRRLRPLVLVPTIFAIATFFLFYVVFGVPLPLGQIEKVLQ